MPKVLTACREAMMGSVIEEMLLELGYEPLVYSNGRDVWTALERGVRPDLLLIDRGLPSMSAEQLLVRIKNHSSLKDLPVVVMSGFPGGPDVTCLSERGARAVLRKPIRFSELRKTLMDVFQSADDDVA